MSHDIRREFRRKAQAAGVPFAVLEQTYRALRIMERETRERGWEIRARAWLCVTFFTPKSQGFWRHGFRARFPKAFDGGDYTNIRGFDLIAKEVAAAFPELDDDVDGGCENLFAFLSEPHDCLPPVEETWEQALEMCVENGDDATPETEPWDAALAAAPF
jgi:hypothetical protein